MHPTLHYHSAGTGEPLIILHGLFGSGDNWNGIARRLAPIRRVICVDQRNHGASPHTDVMTYPALAADIVRLIDSLALPRADLLGHSMGGKAAMELALNFAGRVNRLVVVDIAPRAYPPRHREILAALNSINPASFHSRNEIEQALRSAIPDLAVLRFLLKSLHRGDDGGYRWKFGLAEISRNYAFLNQAIPGARVFPGPALLLRGGKSDYVTDADAAVFRSLFPASRIETILDAGHWAHADAPEQFAGIVSAFLGEK